MKTLGWREWVSLPEIGVPKLKAKVDTGARTSALNARDIHPYCQDGTEWVQFVLKPHRRRSKEYVCNAKVSDIREVRDSGGHTERRYVIQTVVHLGTWKNGLLIEVTLANRTGMMFSMLLGRTAIESFFQVDPSISYQAGIPKKLH